jgi:hypothetical protein
VGGTAIAGIARGPKGNEDSLSLGESGRASLGSLPKYQPTVPWSGGMSGITRRNPDYWPVALPVCLLPGRSLSKDRPFTPVPSPAEESGRETGLGKPRELFSLAVVLGHAMRGCVRTSVPRFAQRSGYRASEAATVSDQRFVSPRGSDLPLVSPSCFCGR